MRAPRLAEFGVLGLGLLAVLATFRDYGLTWDERFQSRYGELVLAYFRSGFTDTRCNSFEDLHYYGPLFEAAAALVYGALGGHVPEVRHLMSALAGLLGVAATMRLGGLVGRPWLPALAGLALLTWPRFYGHAFINSKDVPFACGVAWAAFASARWLLRGTRPGDAAMAGLAAGLALSVRPGGLPVLGALLLGAWLLARWRPPAARPADRTLLQLLAAAALAWAVMVALWPWAHGGPLTRPIEALRLSARFPAELPVLFDGVFRAPDSLPRRYVPQYLLITIPPGHLLLLALGGLLAVRPPARWDAPRVFVARLALVWFAAPVLAAVVRKPVLYDEIRHFLFVLPAGALLAGLGLDWAIARLAARAGARAGLAAALLLLPLPSLVRLHPYQYTYFNGLAGGVGRAWRHYEADYWLSSYREAMEWINAQPAIPGRKRRLAVVATPASRWCADYYAGPDLEVKTLAEAQREPEWRYDVFLATTRFRMTEYASAPVVHEVGRDGALFAVVKQRAAP